MDQIGRQSPEGTLPPVEFAGADGVADASLVAKGHRAEAVRSRAEDLIIGQKGQALRAGGTGIDLPPLQHPAAAGALGRKEEVQQKADHLRFLRG